MRNVANNTRNTPQLPTGTWSVALRDQLAKEAIARMGPDTSEERKCEVMDQLVEKLKALRDYDLFDPRQMESVVLKRNYRPVDKIDAGSGARAFQVLPNGTIVSGCDGGGLQIWAQGAEGGWSSQVLVGHNAPVSCFHVISDGHIVASSVDKVIRIWSKGADGRWSAEALGSYDDEGYDQAIQALPDGRIVSRPWNNTIRIWSKEIDGQWRCEGINGYEGRVSSFQALPDGRIVLGCTDGLIRIGTKGADGRWGFEVLDWDTQRLTCLHVLPDGTIVSGSFGGSIRVWTKGSNVQWSANVVSEHAGPVRCLQALPDGRIVSASWNQPIQIWTKTPDARFEGRLRSWMSGQPATTWESEVLSAHLLGFACLQVLPNGRIFSGSQDSTIHIWDGVEIAGGES
jgi:WD40 repeat protein